MIKFRIKAIKNLYCPKCKNYPDNIIERYLEPIEEKRLWVSKSQRYEIEDSNIDSVEFKQSCGKCRTKLEYKG